MSGEAMETLAAAAATGQGWVGSWSPGIGDPNVVGWVTVVGYLVAAGLCWRQYRHLGSGGASRRALGPLLAAFSLAFLGARRRLLAMPLTDRLRALWLGLATVLLLLGINKQLDLQTALTEGARLWAKRAGWYAARRPVQVAFIGAVAALGLATVRAAFLLAHGELRSLRWALAGTVFLGAFVFIRAASFHHIDRLLRMDIGGFRMNWLVEVGGIAFIIAGTYRLRPVPSDDAS
jgi:hypothetical protein